MGAGYYYLPELVNQAALRYADEMGACIHELSVDRPTFTTGRIRKAKFTVNEGTISVRNVRFTFSLDSLRHQRLETIEAENVAISLREQEASTTGEPLTVPDPWQLIPVDKVDIEVLHVSRPPFIVVGHLRLNETEVTLQGAFIYDRTGEHQSSAHFRFAIDPAGAFELGARNLSDASGELEMAGLLRGEMFEVSQGTFDIEIPLRDYSEKAQTSGSFAAALNLNSPLESLTASWDSEVDVHIAKPRRTRLAGRLVGSIAEQVIEIRDSGFRVETEPLTIADQRVRLDQLRLYVEHLQFKEPDLIAKGQVRTHLMAAPINFKVNADPFTQQGSFELSLSRSAGGPFLKDMLPGWKSSYDLDGGELTAGVSGEFGATDGVLDIEAKGVVTLVNGKGHHDTTVFSGLDATAPFSYNGTQFELEPTVFNLDTVDVGLPVTDLSGKVSGTPQQIGLEDFGAAVLGGRISIDSVSIGLDPLATQFAIDMDAVSLGELLALEGDEVMGNGTIDGRLPVEIRGGVVTVDRGLLKARAPGGHLAYLGNIPSSNPGLDLAIRALRNFDYEILEAEANMAEDGELKLLVKLHGSSPDVENGRPIHFNVNVTENIPVLLESLRASQSLTDRVQQRLSR